MAENENSAGMGGGASMYNIGYQSQKADLAPSGGVLGGLDQVHTALKNRQASIIEEMKAEEKVKTDARVAAGKELTNTIMDFDDSLVNLGQPSFAQAQAEVEALREQMYQAIDADDQKLIAELNLKLKDIKTRHNADAENLKVAIDDWGSDLVSPEAMTPENLNTYKGFINGKKDGTAKEIYEGEPPTLYYEFNKLDEHGQPIQIIDEATGEGLLDENNEPVYEKEKKSLTDLTDMTVPRDSEGGGAILDYTEEQAKLKKEGGAMPSDNAIKKQISKTIPKDKKKIRDWLWGNPADADTLDVQSYLFDLLSGEHVVAKDNQYELYQKMGVPEIGEPDGVYDEQELAAVDKKEIIRAIMEVDDLELSHGIITEIYTDIVKNNIMGEPNKDYNAEKNKSLTNSKDASELDSVRRQKVLDLYKDIKENPQNYKGMTKKLIAAKWGLTEADLEGVATGEGGMINLDSQLSNPTAATSIGDTSNF